jgi:HAD superfamily 5'-nucleotidase-like hydrolase
MDSRNGNPRKDEKCDKRAYVNRLLDFSHIGTIGLDLDHTLAVYNDQAVNEAAYTETARGLAAAKGYPAEITDGTYDNSRIIRGICADASTGWMLKLDRDNRIVRASDGRGQLDTGFIRSVYPDGVVSPDGPGFDTLDSPFDLPVGALFPRVVLSVSRPDSIPADFSRVLHDVRETLDHTHTRGTLKSRILKAPHRFLHAGKAAADPLLRLRKAGFKTFLLTNSGYEYAVGVLDHLLPADSGASWRYLFDAVIVDAGKPDFFARTGGGDAVPCETGAPDDPAPIHSARSADWLERHLGTRGSSILYIGDNPSDDCAAAASYGWSTALVVPEIRHEHFSPDDVSPARSPAGAGWGSVFHENGRRTRFGRFLAETPDLYAASYAPIADLCVKRA